MKVYVANILAVANYENLSAIRRPHRSRNLLHTRARELHVHRLILKTLEAFRRTGDLGFFHD